MVLKKINPPNEEQIVTRNKFIVNDIFPIAIQATPIELNKFIILFQAHQDYDDSFIYIQIMVQAENDFIDKEFFVRHPLNMDNIKNNKDIQKIYNNMISKMNGNNLYISDLKMTECESQPMYFQSCGIKVIDNTHASVLDLYIPRDNYVKIMLYLDTIQNRPFSFFLDGVTNHEAIFSCPKFHNIEFVRVETVKLDGTRHFEGNKSLFTSHYTMHCGPSKYVMNWNVGAVCNTVNGEGEEVVPPLINPMDKSLYDPFYSNDYFVDFLFIDNEILHVLYEERSPIDYSFKKMKLLKLTKDLYDKTNFVNFGKIFMKKEGEE